MDELHYEVLSNGLRDILIKIQSAQGLQDFYLAGGTSLALQLGHRISDDLDFFSEQEFSANIINILSKPYKVISLHANSIEVSISGNKIMFMYFAFPLSHKLKTIDGIVLADPIDIGLMKLLALQGRSTKKDIIDLFFIDQEVLPLEDLLALFETTYPKESFNVYSSLKALINPEDIEGQPEPQMLISQDFETAFKLVTAKVSDHIKSILHN